MAITNAEAQRRWRERQKIAKGSPVRISLTKGERETLMRALESTGMQDNPLYERLKAQ